jgi:transketolase
VASRRYDGRNIQFGVREHVMGAMANGIALHGGFRPYTATFFMFYDYMKNPVRLAALMRLPVVFIYTHDSVGLGEDGPTHQPVENLAAARAVPNLYVFRPGDANETAESWRVALRRTDGPSMMVLSRQNLPVFDRSSMAPASGVQRGGYVLRESANGRPDALLVATGSELSLAVEAAEKLEAAGVATRVVSLPCFRLFDEQPQEYRDEVLPPDVTARVAVEAASPFGWDRYVGLGGAVVGIDRFGASAPGPIVMKELGMNVDNVVATVRRVAGRA